jgi:3-oxoacyl-[acyl-carrier-protein] synthase III
MIVVGTTTPDQVFPNTGVLLQSRLGMHGLPAFSVEAACTGFIYALAVADKFVRRAPRTALVVGPRRSAG